MSNQKNIFKKFSHKLFQKKQKYSTNALSSFRNPFSSRPQAYTQHHKDIKKNDTYESRSNSLFKEKIASDSYKLQLELLHKSLNINTAALFTALASENLYKVSGIVSDRQDIIFEPFPMGTGITGAIQRGQNEVSMVDVNPNYSGMPCYKNPGGIGSLFALRLPGFEVDNANQVSNQSILYVDRAEKGLWSEYDREILQLVAEKLAIEIKVNQQITKIGRERNFIQKICSGFRELNRGLGLESVFIATANAISSFVDSDFISISLLANGTHHTAFISDDGSNEHLLGMEYDSNEGIVGQVIRLNHPLPANAQYNGPAPVFSRYHSLNGYNSLYILPLKPDKGEPFGALTVASYRSGLFDNDHQEILELIAAQVAIKIDLAKSHEMIHKMATTDGLTDLANHRTFQHAFDVMLHRARRRSSPLSVVICDIDFFKNVNDQYGHPFGDKVLKRVAKTISETVRKIDLAARYGGEEFGLILENSDKEGAYRTAERLRQDIESIIFDTGDDRIRVTISLGIASFPEDGSTKTEIIELADQALYSAKRKGRNQTIVWNNKLQNSSHDIF